MKHLNILSAHQCKRDIYQRARSFSKLNERRAAFIMRNIKQQMLHVPATSGGDVASSTPSRCSCGSFPQSMVVPNAAASQRHGRVPTGKVTSTNHFIETRKKGKEMLHIQRNNNIVRIHRLHSSPRFSFALNMQHFFPLFLFSMKWFVEVTLPAGTLPCRWLCRSIGHDHGLWKGAA